MTVLQTCGHPNHGAPDHDCRPFRPPLPFMHYATVPEIAALFGWTEAYVRKLASTQRWHGQGRHPRRYALTDVGDYCCRVARVTVDQRPTAKV